jgi:HTH-type transcriptional regulator/antitoxin HigA
MEIMKTNNNIANLVPAYAIHPGEYISDELEAQDMSQSNLAKLIGIEKSQLNEIIKGKRGINAEIALLLQAALGIDADFWINAQKNYELDLAKINDAIKEKCIGIETYNSIKSQIPFSYFKKKGIIEGNPKKDIPKIIEIYGISSINKLPEVYNQKQYARFKKSEKLATEKVNLIGWCKLVEYNSKQIEVGNFDPSKYEILLEKLRQIFYENKNTKERVKQVLDQFGIVFLIQEKADKTPVDGISFWNQKNPVIGLTLRHNRIDNFAFTLFHELGHIYKHLSNDNRSEEIFIDIEKDTDLIREKEEQEANQFAMTSLIPEDKWQSFYHGYLSYNEKDINGFAEEIKLHPAIIRGRISFILNDYTYAKGIDDSIN